MRQVTSFYDSTTPKGCDAPSDGYTIQSIQYFKKLARFDDFSGCRDHQKRKTALGMTLYASYVGGGASYCGNGVSIFFFWA